MALTPYLRQANIAAALQQANETSLVQIADNGKPDLIRSDPLISSFCSAVRELTLSTLPKLGINGCSQSITQKVERQYG